MSALPDTVSEYAGNGQRLAEKVVVVTGAGTSAPGIGNGRASAILMAREGARVAILTYSGRRPRILAT